MGDTLLEWLWPPMSIEFSNVPFQLLLSQTGLYMVNNIKIKFYKIYSFLVDSIYTERFMGLPTLNDNLEGYKKAELLNKCEGLRDKLYFLVHGTLDDNVHYQQSMMLSKVLEEKDIMFRQQVRQNKNRKHERFVFTSKISRVTQMKTMA